jgi:thioredoxin-like negative regulator of GroEL
VVRALSSSVGAGKVVKAAKGKVKLVKMDIDKHPASGQLGIQSIPAVFAFVSQPVDGSSARCRKAK